MIVEETLNKLLRDTVDLLLGNQGYTIRARQQNSPRPTEPYADVGVLSDLSLGWEQKEYTDRTGDEDIDIEYTGMRQITYSVGFYRDDAFDNARKVRTGYIKESIQEIFKSANVGLTSRSDVRSISETLEDTWEERAQFDLSLSVIGSDQDIIRSILEVDISGEYQARGLSYNFEIEVS